MINTNNSKPFVLDILAGMKKIVTIYSDAQRAAERVKKDAERRYTPEYITEEVDRQQQLIYARIPKLFEEIYANIDNWSNFLKECDADLELDNDELMRAISILKNSDKSIDGEIIHALADKFKGHKKGLQMLAATTPEESKLRFVFDETIVDVNASVEQLKADIELTELEFPKNIISILSAHKKLVALGDCVGLDLTDAELDLGENAQSIAELQLRFAFGI